MQVIALALVYHDIALWSDKKLSYIEPSVDRAKKDLKSVLDEADLKLVEDIIYWHHKITPYKGEHEDIVNAVIKSDLIDFSRGIITKGMPRKHIAKVSALLPNAGFHQTLMEIGFRFYGWNVIKIVKELSTIFK